MTSSSVLLRVSGSARPVSERILRETATVTDRTSGTFLK